MYRPINNGTPVKGIVMVLRNDWSTKGWKPGPVTLQEAFGIKKGTVSFPPLQPVLANQVANSMQSGPKTSQGQPSGGTGGGVNGTEAQNKALGQKMAAAVGWTGIQWTDLNNIVMAESGWNVHAANPSGAYGIPQALPGSKMASAGPNWQNSAQTQIKWMLGYIRSTYGNPANAWAFHLANGWY